MFIGWRNKLGCLLVDTKETRMEGPWKILIAKGRTEWKATSVSIDHIIGVMQYYDLLHFVMQNPFHNVVISLHNHVSIAGLFL